MADSAEVNTRWISVWIMNDDLYYEQACEVANMAEQLDDYSVLREYIQAVLNSRATETVQAIASEMSEADMDTVDWAEVADCLCITL
jgi:hypothetical protein